MQVPLKSKICFALMQSFLRSLHGALLNHHLVIHAFLPVVKFFQPLGRLLSPVTHPCRNYLPEACISVLRYSPWRACFKASSLSLLTLGPVAHSPFLPVGSHPWVFSASLPEAAVCCPGSRLPQPHFQRRLLARS